MLAFRLGPDARRNPARGRPALPREIQGNDAKLEQSFLYSQHQKNGESEAALVVCSLRSAIAQTRMVSCSSPSAGLIRDPGPAATTAW